jgi:spermidine/putrescine transport system substrate-binding protein/spermidine/putrescine transport system permease protein
VLDEMSAEDGEYGDNEAYMPRVGYANDEIYHDNETLRIKLSELWSKVKAE